MYGVPFVQPFALTLYTYVTDIGAAVVLVNISLTFPVPLLAASVIPPTKALLQANVDPPVELVAVYINGEPLHTAAGVKVLVSNGVGLTITTTFCEGPEQRFAVVTYTYVTDIGDAVV